MIIGISGKIGTGKSTIAGHAAMILRQAGERVEAIPFGMLLKKECSLRFQFPLEYTMSQAGKQHIIFHYDLPGGAMSVRRILQWYGTDVCRAKDPAHWIKLMGVVLDGVKSGVHIIIDDVRFANEAQLVQDRGGFLVRVHPYQGYRLSSDAGHKSETALDTWDDWDLELSPELGDPALFNAALKIVTAIQERGGQT